MRNMQVAMTLKKISTGQEHHLHERDSRLVLPSRRPARRDNGDRRENERKDRNDTASQLEP
jgi:hypothetical protein